MDHPERKRTKLTKRTTCQEGTEEKPKIFFCAKTHGKQGLEGEKCQKRSGLRQNVHKHVKMTEISTYK